jgi:PBP1b-binding outer membrane lipoprotein LpoB
MKRSRYVGLFLILALVLAACSSADPTATPQFAAVAAFTEEVMDEEMMDDAKTIVEIAVVDG